MAQSSRPGTPNSITLRPLVYNAEAEAERLEHIYVSTRPIGEWVDHPLQVNHSDSCEKCVISGQAFATSIMREVGISIEKTLKTQSQMFDLGMESHCKHCINWFFRMSEALEYHAEMLRAKQLENGRALVQAVNSRSGVFRALNYTAL